MTVHFHEEDLPAGLEFADGPIAIDTETMGLITHRDRLCVVQLSDGHGDEHLVRFNPGSKYDAPNLKALMASAPRERSGGASGVIATARLLGQATGAALVALSFGLAGSHGPGLALALGAGFAGVAAIASGLRLVMQEAPH